MTDRPRTTGDDRSQATGTDEFSRREFVALGAGASATLLAGCAGDGSLPSSDGSDGSGDADGSDGSQTLTGNFRLLISDAPADIGDFDRLDVTLDRARVFEAGDGDEEGDDEDDGEADEDDEADDDTDQNATETDDDESPNGTDVDDANETDVDDDEEEVEAEEDEEDDGDDEEDGNEDDEDDDNEGDRGFTVVELDGATVDLTQVIEDDAIAVFDGAIPAGSYEKIELEVSAVEGIVDGESVDVKLPSEKLQITNGFEVTPDEPVSFVFDINVVKRGRNNGYILKPVISGSGVAGRDVDVNEIDDEDDEDDDSEEDDAEDAESEGDDGDSEGDEDDAEEDDATGGNETDGSTGGNQTADAENGTATGS
ncbi:DUF4382 domain-containing protein [Halorubrum sp. SD612]|uniref:DUF4382 domain-containing protein n=1 Tax=Halorubrum sp. SD612 TaxID=1855863 RepID=UPI000A2DD563|nr:DUF4382 domain-containing protein [Halorubrum sp. SD612]OTE99480.1 hypothetical protein B9G38_16715 [Halorubrum sp. SD612]